MAAVQVKHAGKQNTRKKKTLEGNAKKNKLQDSAKSRLCGIIVKRLLHNHRRLMVRQSVG